jgi:hypothetical protein
MPSEADYLPHDDTPTARPFRTRSWKTLRTRVEMLK